MKGMVSEDECTIPIGAADIKNREKM